MKLSKTQLHKIGQSGDFLGKTLEPLPKNGLPLIWHELKPLVKSVLKLLKPLKPIGLRATTSATDAAIHKKRFDLVCFLQTEQSKQN